MRANAFALVMSIYAAIDFVAGDTTSHLALSSEFASKEALAGYRAHPEHKAIVAFVGEAVTERRMVDYEA